VRTGLEGERRDDRDQETCGSNRERGPCAPGRRDDGRSSDLRLIYLRQDNDPVGRERSCRKSRLRFQVLIDPVSIGNHPEIANERRGSRRHTVTSRRQENRPAQLGRDLRGHNMLIGRFGKYIGRPHHDDADFRRPPASGQDGGRAGLGVKHQDIGLGRDQQAFEVFRIARLPENGETFGLQDWAEDTPPVRRCLTNHNCYADPARRMSSHQERLPPSLASRNRSLGIAAANHLMVRASAPHSQKLK